VLTNLGTQGFLFDRYYAAHKGRDIETEASLLLATSFGSPKLRQTPQQNQSQAGLQALQNISATLADRLDEVVAALSNLIERTDNPGSMQALSVMATRHANWRDLVGGLIRYRLQQGGLGALYLDDVIAKLSLWIELAGPEQQLNLLRALERYGGFWDRLAKSTDDTLFFRVVSALSSHAASRTQLSDALVQRLSSKDAQWWQQSLSQDSGPIPIVIDLLKNREVDLGEQFALGLEDHAEQLLKTQDYPEGSWDWSLLTKGLSDSRRATFLKNVLDWMREGSPASIGVGFYLYGSALAETGELMIEADRNARMLVLPVLSSGEQSAIEDVLNLAGQLSPMIQASSAAAKSEMSKRLAELAASPPNENFAEQLSEVKRVWKLSRRKPKKSKG
jgi:hypothetical protein